MSFPTYGFLLVSKTKNRFMMCSQICDVLMCLLNVITRAHHPPPNLLAFAFTLFLFHVLPPFFLASPLSSFQTLTHMVCFEMSRLHSDYSSPAKPSEVYSRVDTHHRLPGEHCPTCHFILVCLIIDFPNWPELFKDTAFVYSSLLLLELVGLKLRSYLQMTWQRAVLAGP